MSKIKWTIESSTDLDYILRRAEELGWWDTPPKVQVRIWGGMETWYLIEPYEENCNCPGLLKPPERSQNAAAR